MYDAQWETVTPEKAEGYLRHNKCNRKVRDWWVNDLAGRMTRREYETNGDALRFSQTGSLIDGQHKLLAIIKSGIAQTLLVVRGLPDHVWEKIDLGILKTSRDNLTRYGYSNPGRLNTVIQLLWAYEKYGRARAIRGRRLTSSQIKTVAESIPSIADSVDEFKSMEKRCVITPGIGYMLWFATRQIQDRREEFFGVLCADIPATKTNAAFALRDRTLLEKSSKKRSSDDYNTALAIKAWNYFAEGREVRCLKIDERESFPIILGYGNDLTKAFPSW